MTGTCLECEEHFDIEEDCGVDDVVQCPHCRTRLEVLDLDPMLLDYADDSRKGADEREEDYIC